MKVLITLAIMLLIDLIVFTLIVPFVIKKGYSWYVKRSCRKTVDVNPIVGFIGGVK
jgi:hypothetical protein